MNLFPKPPSFSQLTEGLDTWPNWIKDEFQQRAINVKWFGAKGDGVTDDTAAIQAAVNALISQGDTLFFPSGKYNISKGIEISGIVDSNNTPLQSFSLVMDGYLAPTSGDITALLIKNFRDSLIQVKLTGGGINSVGVDFYNVKFSKIGVMGKYFAGTLMRVSGDAQTNSKTEANVVEYLLAYNCGRALIHGPNDPAKYNNCGGVYLEIWDWNSQNGSIFQNAHDVTVLDYTNLYYGQGSSLLLKNFHGHFNKLRIGTSNNAIPTSELLRTEGFILINIDEVFMLGNSSYKTVNGLVVNTTEPASKIYITHARIEGCNIALSLKSAVDTSILRCTTLGNTTNITKDGVTELQSGPYVYEYHTTLSKYLYNSGLTLSGPLYLSNKTVWPNIIGTVTPRNDKGVDITVYDPTNVQYYFTHRYNSANELELYTEGKDGILLIGKPTSRIRGVFFAPHAAEPTSYKTVGTVVLADGVTWDPASKASGEPYLVCWDGTTWQPLW